MKKQYANEISGAARLKYRIAALANAGEHTNKAMGNVGTGDEERLKRFYHHAEKAKKRLKGIEASKFSSETRPKTEDISHLGAPKMENKYTLEEWMGALEESGYSLEEGNAENKEKKNAWMKTQDPTPDSSVDAITRGHRNSPGDAAWAKRNNPKRDVTPDTKALDRGRHNLGMQRDPLAIKQWRLGNDETPKDKHVGHQRAYAGSRAKSAAYNPTYVKGMAQYRTPPQQAESYTIEEWMGMMEESGVNLNELSPETLKSYVSKAKASAKEGERKSSETKFSPSGHAQYTKRWAGINKAYGKMGGDPAMATESINENTVSRFQQLAGITPKE